MGRTMAQVLHEEGRLEGMQELLQILLREQFPRLPAEIETLVRATTDEARLLAWGRELLHAKKLADLSFGPAS